MASMAKAHDGIEARYPVQPKRVHPSPWLAEYPPVMMRIAKPITAL